MRFLYSFLMAAGVLAVCCAGSVAAQTVELRFGQAEEADGGLARVGVELLGQGEQPATVLVRMRFDPARLSVIDVAAGTATVLARKQIDYQVTGDTLNAIVYGGLESIATGTLATVVFRLENGWACGESSPLTDAGSNASTGTASEIPLEVTAGNVMATDCFHSADLSRDNRIDLDELLRVIQLYNGGQIHCDSSTADGYAPGAGGQECTRHSSDYRSPAWRLDLGELLRLVQFYNGRDGAYSFGEGSEDGFQPVG